LTASQLIRHGLMTSDVGVLDVAMKGVQFGLKKRAVQLNFEVTGGTEGGRFSCRDRRLTSGA
jgi:hypothetical protein